MAYTDEQKVMALAAYDSCRHNAVLAAKFCRDHYGFNVSHDQVTRWFRGEQIAPDVRENANQILEPLSDRLESLAHKIASRMEATIEDATFSQLSFALNGAVDKMLVLRGQANQITQANLSPEERAVKLAELMRTLQERKAQEGQVLDVEVVE